ncbi:MAG: beta-galactosidase [Polyangiales bacterium]
MSRTPRARSERPSAAAPPRARLDGARLLLGSEVVPFRAGAVDAFRLDPRAWPTALASVRSLGLPLVDVRVPWGTHAVGPDELEFGAHDPRRDLGRFLELAAEAGLRVVLRVGPHVGSDLAYGGLPDHVVRDRRMHARTARGNPIYAHRPPRMHALPSYASSHFRDAVRGWFAGLAGVVAPRCFPSGPVVAAIVDDGCGPHATRPVHGFDHHPEALDGYRRFLEARYASVEALVAAHHVDVTSFEDVLPPNRFDERGPLELRRHLDWAEYQDQLVGETMSTFARSLPELGIDVPCLVGLPKGSGGAAVDAASLAGSFSQLGIPLRGDFPHAARIRRAVRRARGFVASPLALSFSLGAAALERPLAPAADRHTLLVGLAHGIRGFSLECVVDRDRWAGAPFDAEGAEAPFAEGVRSVLRALDEVGFEGLAERVEVAIVVPRLHARLVRSTHLLGPVDPSLLADVLGSPALACRRDAVMSGLDPVEAETWADAIDESLTALGVPYVLVESDAPVLPDSVRLVFAPTLDVVPRGVLDALRDVVTRGGRVVHGPRSPRRDVEGQSVADATLSASTLLPMERPAAMRDRIDGLLAELGTVAPVTVTGSGVETTLHHDAAGPRVVFAREVSGQARAVELSAPGMAALVDLRTGERLASPAAIALEPHEVRIFRLEAAEVRPKARRSTRPPRSRRSP